MIDDLNGHTMREKIMSRRATAQLGLRRFEDAVETLRDRSLAGNQVCGVCPPARRPAPPRPPAAPARPARLQAAQQRLREAVAEVRKGREREAEVARAMFSGGSGKKAAAAAAAASPRAEGKQQQLTQAQPAAVKAGGGAAASAPAVAPADALATADAAEPGGLSTALVAGLTVGAVALAAAAVYYFVAGRGAGAGGARRK